MKYLIGIPYVNRPDLLKLAVNSIELFWAHAVIIDNSDCQDLRSKQDLPPEITIYEPPVPLTFSQTMNLLFRLGEAQQCDVVMYMHNDAEAQAGTPEALLSLLRSLSPNSERKWGAVFTNYDSLAAFNMEAVRVVGWWDTALPQYFADDDYYRRIKLEGYEIIETNLAVTHDTSSTIKSDATKGYLNSVTFPLYKVYYVYKWGGEPGSETYEIPFRLACLKPYFHKRPLGS